MVFSSVFRAAHFLPPFSDPLVQTRGLLARVSSCCPRAPRRRPLLLHSEPLHNWWRERWRNSVISFLSCDQFPCGAHSSHACYSITRTSALLLLVSCLLRAPAPAAPLVGCRGPPVGSTRDEATSNFLVSSRLRDSSSHLVRCCVSIFWMRVSACPSAFLYLYVSYLRAPVYLLSEIIVSVSRNFPRARAGGPVPGCRTPKFQAKNSPTHRNPPPS